MEGLSVSCNALDELKEFSFISYIRKKKTQQIVNALLTGYNLFVPYNISLPICLKRIDISKQTDDIHYKTLSDKNISIIGNEIRTYTPFPEVRCIHYIREYILKADEVLYVFDINEKDLNFTPQSELEERGVICPQSEEMMTYEQMTYFMSYLGLTCYLNPYINKLYNSITVPKEVRTPRQSYNSISFLRDSSNNIKKFNSDVLYSYKKALREEGRSFQKRVNLLVQLLCSRYTVCRERQYAIQIIIHHYLLHAITGKLVQSIIEHFADQITAFDNARSQLVHITYDDLGIPPDFRFTFRKSLAQFNCTYFQFNYHPESVLPLTVLQCWDQLLTDIRYELNMEFRSDTTRKRKLKDTALSTDDLISITIYILIQSNLSSSLPAHFALVENYTPCELSCSVLGYAYGIMETAMTWILKNGKSCN